nr:hypothetical protein CFP56_14728 [Quercus suber]
MDEFFTLYVHHGGYFSGNPQELWYKMPRDNEEGRKFHLINDDHDTMLMTNLVRGHGQIHVYVERPVHEPILINGGNGVILDLIIEPEDVEPLDVSELDGYSSSEPEHAYDGYYNGHAPTNVNGNQSDSNVKVLGYKRPDKELVVEEPQEDGAVTIDSNDSDEDSDVEEARQMNPNQRYG